MLTRFLALIALVGEIVFPTLPAEIQVNRPIHNSRVAAGHQAVSRSLETSNPFASVSQITATTKLLPQSIQSLGVIASIPVGSIPRGLTVNPVTNQVYVANSGDNYISVIDSALNTVGTTITVGIHPYDVSVNPNTNRIYVPNNGSSSLSVIDGTSNTVITTIQGLNMTPQGVAVHAERNLIYSNYGASYLAVIDGVTNVISTVINTGAYNALVAVDSGLDRVYVSRTSPDVLDVIDADTNTIINYVGVPGHPTVNPLTHQVYLADFTAPRLRILDGLSNNLVATATLDYLPSRAAINPSANCLYITEPTGNRIAILDGLTLAPFGTIAVGNSPSGIAVNSATGLVYVANQVDDTVSVVQDVFCALKTPPANVTLTGPTAGRVGNTYTFTATVGPLSTTVPITYVWQATGQLPVTRTVPDQMDTYSVTWTATSSGAITVTALNQFGAMTSTLLFNGYDALYVSSDGNCGTASPCFSTIQAALDAANEDDTIKVAQGTYTSSDFQVAYITKGITLTGGYIHTDWVNSYPVSRTTIIDAAQSAAQRGIYIDGGLASTINLSAFTIQHGATNGGGVYILTGTVAIQQNSIQTNTNGSAVYIANGTIKMNDNVFQNNGSRVTTTFGGAVYAANCTGILRNNTFQDNVSDAGGGGIYADNSYLTIDNSLFQRNSAGFGRGGGIYIHNNAVVVSNTRFISNTALGDTEYGNGLYVESGDVSTPGSNSVVITNNVFQDNVTAGRFGSGVGLYIYMSYDTPITISHNVFLRNNLGTNSLSGLGIGANVASLGKVTMNNNLFQENSGSNVPLYGASVVDVASYGEVTILDENTVVNNESSGLNISGLHSILGNNTIVSNEGYGLVLSIQGAASLANNFVFDNAGFGIEVNAQNSVTLTGSTIMSNTDNGLMIGSGIVVAQNDIIANNASAGSAGIYLYNTGSVLNAQHLTLANNGSYAVLNNGGSAIFSNTLVTSHTLYGLIGPGITADKTLFFNNGAMCGGGVVCNHNLMGDPRFINPFAFDYHIGPGSAAIDQGIVAGVTSDIDGDPRPMRSSFDIGADELPDAPVAGFTLSAPNWVSQTTIFTGTNAVSGTATFAWNFGDGTLLSGQSLMVSHTYSAAGNYTAILTVTNNAGSSVTSHTATIYGLGFTSSSPDWLGQTTLFTNTSVVSGVTAYQWDFGDGITSTASSPTHTYLLPALYTATLTANNVGAGSAVVSDPVVVYGTPAANFVASPLSGVRPLTVVFTDTSTTIPFGDPTVLETWNFGEGTGVSGQWPVITYTYTNAGSYTVTLGVSNTGGSDTITRTAYINVAYIPSQADFSATPLTGLTPSTVTFANTSTGDYTAVLWDFGDGMTSTLLNPIHIYTRSGMFTATLTISGPGGTDTLTRTNYITTYAPVHASFSVTPTAGIAPFQVVFTNSSTGDYTAALWDFGDGFTSTLLNPTHIYTQAGMFTVALAMSGPGGTDTLTQTNYITAYAPVHAAFNAAPPGGIVPLSVVFANTSTGDYTATLWNFGDNVTSTLLSPTHVYTQSGVFTVVLAVNGSGGSDTVTKTNYITAYAPVHAAFEVDPVDGLAPVTAVFTNTSTGDFTLALWNFGDNVTSTLPSPTHTFSSGGRYTVTLTVSNPFDASSAQQAIVVRAPHATVSPNALQVTLNPNDIALRTLQVSNSGDADLIWNVAAAPSVGWLTVAPLSGSLAPQSSRSITITFDAHNLAAGTYTTSLHITSNDPLRGFIAVPVTMTVVTTPIPNIQVSPAALTLLLNPGDAGLRHLTIGNIGTGDLTWLLTEIPAVDWLGAMPLSGTLQPAAITEISVNFNAGGLSAGTYSTTLRVTSNDPDQPQLDVPVTLLVSAVCAPVSPVEIDRVPAGEVFTGDVVHFTASATGTVPFTYTWTVNTAPLGANLNTFDQVFDTSGLYTVVVTVTNACGQDNAALPVTVQPRLANHPDLSASYKTVDLASVESGDTVTYTVLLRNQTAITAAAHMTDPLPAYTTYLPGSAVASDGHPVTFNDGQLIWSGDIVSGTPVVIQYAVTVQAAPIGATIANVAQLDDGLGIITVLEAQSTYNPGFSLSINDGVLYTNIPTVSLTLNWSASNDIDSLKISNDGGFGAGGNTTVWLPVTTTYTGWVMSTYGDLRIPRTVYAKFRTVSGVQFGPVQDDIIYDPIAPPAPTVQLIALSHRQDLPVSQNVIVRVTAIDDNSGIGTLQLSNTPDFATPAEFTAIGPTTDILWLLQSSGKLYVRAIDRAKNQSLATLATMQHKISLPLILK